MRRPMLLEYLEEIENEEGGTFFANGDKNEKVKYSLCVCE